MGPHAHVSATGDRRMAEAARYRTLYEALEALPEGLIFVRRTEVFVPDLAGWRRERMPEIPPDPHFEVVPDWICEILSPSTRSTDREVKMPLYARYGVTDAWIIDPDAKTLEAYELRGAQWAQLGVYGADDTAAAAPFEVATFRVGDLWR